MKEFLLKIREFFESSTTTFEDKTLVVYLQDLRDSVHEDEYFKLMRDKGSMYIIENDQPKEVIHTDAHFIERPFFVKYDDLNLRLISSHSAGSVKSKVHYLSRKDDNTWEIKSLQKIEGDGNITKIYFRSPFNKKEEPK